MSNDYTPTWNLPNLKSGTIALGNDMELYNLAMDTAQKGFYNIAENLLDSVLKSYPDSNISITAVRDYLSIEESGLRNFERIKQKYSSNPVFQQNEKLARAATFMVKECNLRMGNYVEAIAWLESEIAVPYSFADSVCALIDLGHAYALMANAGYKLSPAKAPNGQDLPLTSEQYYGWYNYHLKNFNQVQSHAQVIPCDTCGTFMGCAMISLHPNPVSNGQVVIEFMQPTDQMLSISLYNQLGQIMLQRNSLKIPLNKRIMLRLPECKKGVCFLRVQTTDMNCTYKLIIN
jgi:tetratricopeptide (TPR) repeat protein